MANRIVEKIGREWLFLISLTGVVSSSLYLGRFPYYSKTDFKVVYILLVFLVIIKGLERSGLLKAVAVRSRKGSWLSIRLILLTSVLALFITNDVALLTIVPLTLAMEVDNSATLVALETLAANAASALTPFGNPQNIFIYYYFDLHPLNFVKAISPLCIVSLSFILLMGWKYRGIGIKPNLHSSIRLTWHSYSYLVFFALVILAVVQVLPLWVGVATIFYALAFDRKSLLIDWVLLGTFLAFFGFTDNLIKMVNFKVEGPIQSFIYPALSSQLISNVPSALFFADFSSSWKGLLWGVSVGGFGSLLGSIASLISYRIYCSKNQPRKEFLVKFHTFSYMVFFLGILTYIIFYL